MFVVLLTWVAYVFLLIRFIFYGLRFGSFLTTLAIFAVAFIVLVFWDVHYTTRPRKRRQAAPQRPAAQKPATKSSVPSVQEEREISFRVAGTTYDNDDGSSRQEILRHLKFGDAPYTEDPDDLLVTIEETSFDGDLALAVYINSYQIGYVPKSKISQVKKALDSYAWTTDAVSIIGGGKSQEGKPLSWGCSITISY